MLTLNFSKNSNTHGIVFPPGGLTLNLQTQGIAADCAVPTHATVPFPRNCVASTDYFGLYEDGIRIPAQIETVGTWDLGNSPKWMHVYFTARYDSGVARTYVLMQEIADNPPATDLTCVDNAGIITVANGYIKFEVSKTAFSGVSKLWFDSTGLASYGSPIVNSSTGGPTIQTENGSIWKAVNDSSVVVTVEQSGTNKVVIKATGSYKTNVATTASVVFAYFTTRITAYDTHPTIRIQHATTFELGVQSNRMRDMSFPINLTNATAYEMGIDGSSVSGSLSAPVVDLLKDLALYLPFTETSGSRVDTVYGNSFAVSGSPSRATGRVTYGVQLTKASAQYMSISNATIPAVLAQTGTQTISCWVYLDSKSALHTISARYDANVSGDRPWFLYYDQSADRFKLYASNGATTATVTANNFGSPSISTWYHIVAEHINGSQITIRVNDGTADTASFTVGLATSTVGYSIGTAFRSGSPDVTTNYYYNGRISEYAHWNRQLTSGEITALYNSGSGFAHPFGFTEFNGYVENAYLHQNKFDGLRLLGAALGEDTGTMETSSGWIQTTGGGIRATLMHKNTWQKFPKEFEASTTNLALHIWPIHGNKPYTATEELLPSNIHKCICFHQGTMLDLRLPNGSNRPNDPNYYNEYYNGPSFESSVNTSTEVWTAVTDVNFITGDAVRISTTGAVPTSSPQVATGTNYYARVLTSTTFELYDTAVHALASPATTGRIDFSTTGSGVHRIGKYEYYDEIYDEGDAIPGAFSATCEGMSIVDEFALELSASADAYDADEKQGIYQFNPIATPDGDWSAETEVFGPIAEVGTDFAEVEEVMEAAFASQFGMVEYTEDYGMFNYGDTHHQFLYSKNRVNLHRCWYTNHYFSARLGWILFMRGGSNAILSNARRNIEHYGSVDVIRPPASSYIGFWHKGLIHWYFGGGSIGHHPDPIGLLYSYLVDDNRWNKDGYDWFIAAVNNYIYFRVSGTARETTSELERVTSFYQYTHDPKVLPAMYGMAAGASAVDIVDNQPGAIWNPFWPVSYYEQTKDPVYGDASTGYIVESADILSAGTDDGLNISGKYGNNIEVSWSMALNSKAYELTSNTDYLTQFLQTFYHNKYNIYYDGGATLLDGSGIFPGAQQESYFMLQWPTLKKQLREAAISDASLPLTTYLSYPTSEAVIGLEDNRRCKVYILKSVDEQWHYGLYFSNVVEGDIYSGVTKIYSPTNVNVTPSTSYVNVSGTAVTWVSGPTFPIDGSWVGRGVNINDAYSGGANYLVSSVADSTHLTLNTTGGTLSNARFDIHLNPNVGTSSPRPLCTPTGYQFTVPADGETGLYQALAGVQRNALASPLNVRSNDTHFAEAVVLKNRIAFSFNSSMVDCVHFGSKTHGYMTPLVSYDLLFTVAVNDAAVAGSLVEFPTTILIKDSTDATILDTQISINNTTSETFTLTGSNMPWTMLLWDQYRLTVEPATSTQRTISSVNTGTEEITTSTAHGYSDGDEVLFTTSGTLPTGLNTGSSGGVNNYSYFVKVVSGSVFKVASSLANLNINSFVNLSSSGSGTHTIHRGEKDLVLFSAVAADLTAINALL